MSDVTELRTAEGPLRSCVYSMCNCKRVLYLLIDLRFYKVVVEGESVKSVLAV